VSRVLTAAAGIFLHRLTGARDLVLGLPVAARNATSRGVPGMASNVMPLRLALHPGMAVSEIIAASALQLRRGLEHQLYPIADLRRAVVGGVDSRSLFGLSLNIMRFDYDFSFADNRAIAHNLSLGPVDDLSIQVYDRSHGSPLRLEFDANPASYSAHALADHQQRFLRLRSAAVAAPEGPIGALDILEPSERAPILRGWNDTARPLPLDASAA